MLARIAKHVSDIEQFIASTLAAQPEHHVIDIEEDNRSAALREPLIGSQTNIGPNIKLLKQIVSTLKQTYTLRNSQICPTMSIRQIAKRMRSVHQLIDEELKPHTHITTDNTYLQLLVRIKTAIDREAIYLTNIAVNDAKNNAQLIIPLSQGLDPRVDDGMCMGYFFKWAEDMLHYAGYLDNKRLKQNVDSHDAVLGLVPYSQIASIDLLPNTHSKEHKNNNLSALGHLALVTNEIMALQNGKQNDVVIAPEHISKYLRSANELAAEMLNTADNNISKVIYVDLRNAYTTNPILNFREKISDHAAGFMKTSDHCYHFFDANSGWRRFLSASDFQKWLPSYYHSTISANKTVYHQFALSTVSLKCKDSLTPQSTRFIDKIKRFFIQMLLVPTKIFWEAIKSIITFPRLVYLSYQQNKN